jgi:hypothetical protein
VPAAAGRAGRRRRAQVTQKMAARTKRRPDSERVNKLAEELSARHAPADRVAAGQFKRYRVMDKADDLVVDYATEVMDAVLEQAATLAKHRQSTEITIADIQLVFGALRGL